MPAEFSWTLPALLVLQKVNEIVGWWSFTQANAWLSGMPLELYLGWAIAWGILPQIALRKLPIVFGTACMVAVDLIMMPLCTPVVVLGPRWLLGEAVAAVLVLAPALCIARWTLENENLRVRAWMQVAISGGVFLYLLPEIVFAVRRGQGWAPLLGMPGWERQILLQLIAVLALPGVGAVVEFVERGGGTPIPFDPPVRLVTSGIYRYCANPMALSCAVVLLAWAVLLRNGWLLLAPVASVVYSAGLADWDEGEDMQRRFGKAWETYRAAVRNWFPRWSRTTRENRHSCIWRQVAAPAAKFGGGSKRASLWEWKFCPQSRCPSDRYGACAMCPVTEQRARKVCAPWVEPLSISILVGRSRALLCDCQWCGSLCRW